jgi:hypothetical protein
MPTTAQKWQSKRFILTGRLESCAANLSNLAKESIEYLVPRNIEVLLSISEILVKMSKEIKELTNPFKKR